MKVVKTIKLFIGGEFVRSESGRTFVQKDYARLCLASKKDFRNTVEKAITGHAAWSKRSAFNKSQILYRMAEMMESKKSDFIDLFTKTQGLTPKKAEVLFRSGVDTFVYYAGFCDKYSALTSSVNPAGGRVFNTTAPGPMGVVTLIEGDKFSFEYLIDQICSIITSGNSLIVLLGKGCPSVLAPFSEVFATSDLPAGAINLLTGDYKELYKVIGGHGELNGISFLEDSEKNKKIVTEIQNLASESITRVIPFSKNKLCLENIVNYVEQKTLWQTIGK